MPQIEPFHPEFDTVEEIQKFVKKFRKVKASDEVATPAPLYRAVLDFACERYGLDREKVVRPFYLGGDYQNDDYSGGAVVMDNPPVSIYKSIIQLYQAKSVPFFLSGHVKLFPILVRDNCSMILTKRLVPSVEAFDERAQKNAFDMACIEFKKVMGTEGIETLNGIIGDANSYIKNLIEAKVRETKPVEFGEAV